MGIIFAMHDLTHLLLCLVTVGQLDLQWPEPMAGYFTKTDKISSGSFVNLGGVSECSLRPHAMPPPVFAVFTSVFKLVVTFVIVHVYWKYLHVCAMNLVKKVKKSTKVKEPTPERRKVKITMSMIALLYMLVRASTLCLFYVTFYKY